MHSKDVISGGYSEGNIKMKRERERERKRERGRRRESLGDSDEGGSDKKNDSN